MISQPYVIEIKNTTGSTQNDLILFDAFRSLSATNFGLPAGVDVSAINR